MATTVTEQQNGGTAGSAEQIEVHNPATGQLVATLPAATPEQVVEMVARAREAQTAWHALGFDGRGKILRRAQKWLLDNSDRVMDTVVSETGKTREDVAVAELGYMTAAFGFWAKQAPKYLADEKVRTTTPFLIGRKLIVRYEPVGVAGVIGPWNYPLSNSIGDAIPALAAGNSVIVKPSSVTPLSALIMQEGLRESGVPDDVFQILVGRGPIGLKPDRRGRLRDVHRLDRDRSDGHGAGGQDAHARVTRARRQGPDDRARRCQPRAGGQLGRVLVDAERRPDLHLDRAGLRRSTDLRRVRLRP